MGCAENCQHGIIGKNAITIVNKLARESNLFQYLAIRQVAFIPHKNLFIEPTNAYFNSILSAKIPFLRLTTGMFCGTIFI
jgi:hypothetical protein